MTSVFRITIIFFFCCEVLAWREEKPLIVFEEDLPVINLAIKTADPRHCGKIPTEDKKSKSAFKRCLMRAISSSQNVNFCKQLKEFDKREDFAYLLCIVRVSILTKKNHCKGKFSNTTYENRCNERVTKGKLRKLEVKTDGKTRADYLKYSVHTCHLGSRARDKYCYKRSYTEENCSEINHIAFRDICYKSIGSCDRVKSLVQFNECLKNGNSKFFMRTSLGKLISYCIKSYSCDRPTCFDSDRYDCLEDVIKGYVSIDANLVKEKIINIGKDPGVDQYTFEGVIYQIASEFAKNQIHSGKELCKKIERSSLRDRCASQFKLLKDPFGEVSKRKFNALYFIWSLSDRKDDKILDDVDISFFSANRFNEGGFGDLELKFYSKSQTELKKYKVGGEAGNLVGGGKGYMISGPFTFTGDEYFLSLSGGNGIDTGIIPIASMILLSLSREVPPGAIRKSFELSQSLVRAGKTARSADKKSISEALAIIRNESYALMKSWSEEHKPKFANYKKKTEFKRQIERAVLQLIELEKSIEDSTTK